MKFWRLSQGLEKVDRELKGRAPLAAPDPELHDSIMRAVRSAAPRSSPVRPTSAWWLVPISAAAAGLAVAFLVNRERPTPPPVKAAPQWAAVFDLTDGVSNSVPDLVMAPLSDELANVNQDVKNTTKMLLAGFP